MKIEELKKQRFIRQLQSESSSRFICDLYKDVKTVKISVQMTFNSAVLRKPCIKELKRNLSPSDRLYLHYECINKDCTSEGFDLPRDLKLALDSRSCIEGNMSCTGKEDWKYFKASGCSCRTSIKYTIEPEFY